MATNLESIRERATSWSVPITPDAPTGTSAKQLPAYEGVIQEVAKLQSPAEAASVDWQRIVESGREILQKRSKDLPIASYVALGLYSTSTSGGAALGGLLEGTLMLGDLMDQYWPTLFPEPNRVKARANALNWFVERASGVLAKPAKGTVDREVLVALQHATERVAQISRERLANDSPGFGPLLKALEQLVLSSPAPSAPRPEAPAAPPPSSASASDSMVQAAPAPALPDLADPANATSYLREMGSALVSSALRVRQANPQNASSYRILRAGLWLHLDAPPTNGPDGKTAVPPLPAAKRAQLQAMEEHGKWAELLEESEASLVQNRFNLDLQRISARALEMLGPTHQAAREAALAELSAWLRRVPGAVDLVANDGSPMADAETRKWIDKEVRNVGVAPARTSERTAAASGDDKDSKDSEDAKVLEEARKLASGKKYLEAIRLIQARIDAVPAEKAKFALRLFLAKLCADNGLSAAAKALYLSLDEQCLQHGLDVWDPALAASCLEGLLRCARGDRGPLPAEFAPQLQRLCRLAPAAALSANGLLATR
jgi:type VI secretion system protein VasJ